ncbi:MAG: succinate dehydrogenase, hydrophobic membrane anchor protein [Proteobacteria bacterium]|nr:MAG: succinate dehydrogenase, hydrophobic membrane anchor protein [Pseudomonadota bacterium]
MSLRSPIGRVLGLGAAHEGVSHWWTQRVSAVALLGLGPWLLISLLVLGAHDYATVVQWAARPWNAVLLVLTVATLFYHSYLGVQVVVEDYVSHKGAKVAALLTLKFLHVVLAAIAIFAVLRVALGAAP